MDLSKFHGDMKITQVKLEHVSGSVTCAAGVTPSYWGCNNKTPATYTSEVNMNPWPSASADLEVQLVQLNHCDGVYSNY